VYNLIKCIKGACKVSGVDADVAESFLTGALEGLSITPFPAGRLIGSSVWRISWQGEVGTWRMLLCTCLGSSCPWPPGRSWTENKSPY
jgi:hypothetical protein